MHTKDKTLLSVHGGEINTVRKMKTPEEFRDFTKSQIQYINSVGLDPSNILELTISVKGALPSPDNDRVKLILKDCKTFWVKKFEDGEVKGYEQVQLCTSYDLALPKYGPIER